MLTTTSRPRIVDVLVSLVGADAVVTDEASRTFYSTDISRRGETALAVVKVVSTEQLSAVLKACSQDGVVTIPRGGGFSYTGGYLPVVPNTVLIDMRGIDQIVEINETDMYVRVGAGCTWANLYQALKAKGLRTPYFGPMSGYHATVGGALSQGSFFLGSTEYGVVAESVLSLEVVLADGSVIHTGSHAGGDTFGPFFRNFGPDLTGIFLSDTGAFGFKTVATIKLIRFPEHQAYGSFSFDRGEDALAALSEVTRAGLAAEAYVWDPYFVEQMRNASLGTKQDLKFLWEVLRNGANLVDGVTAASRIAFNGKRVFKLGTHILQVMMDDLSEAGAAQRLKQVRAIALKHKAFELSPSVPRALRATPFTEFNIPERRTPLRNLPINSLYPHSRAPKALADIHALLAHEEQAMARHGVSVGVIYFAVNRQTICIEPLLYWQDDEHFQHDRVTQSSDLSALDGFLERPAATTFALALRERLKTIMKRNGAVHVQIGKAYEYLPSREPRVAELLRAIKRAVDPDGTVNPGSLGF